MNIESNLCTLTGRPIAVFTMLCLACLPMGANVQLGGGTDGIQLRPGEPWEYRSATGEVFELTVDPDGFHRCS